MVTHPEDPAGQDGVVGRCGLLVVGHGSRSAESNAEFERLVEACRALRPSWRVSHGYIELAEPTLDAALRELGAGCDTVVVAPVFLFAAGHVKRDLPRALCRARAEFPQTDFRLADALGAHPEMVALALDRLREAPGPNVERDLSAVLVVGRGARDAAANADFAELVGQMARQQAGARVVPCFFALSQPGVQATLEQVARLMPARIVVVPYLLFAGQLTLRLAEWVSDFRAKHEAIQTDLASHLGLHPRLLKTIDQRITAVVNDGPANPRKDRRQQ